jgi:hypothetical protein
MKSTASLLVTILVAVVAIWLVLKLLGFALKLVGLLILVALAVGAFVVIRGLLGSGGRRG